MRTFFALLAIASLGFSGCASQKHIVTPSTAAVKNQITEAGNSVSTAKTAVDKAKASSQESSDNIQKFTSSAEEIEFQANKAQKILENPQSR